MRNIERVSFKKLNKENMHYVAMENYQEKKKRK